MSATFADIYASLFAGLTSVFCKKDLMKRLFLAILTVLSFGLSALAQSATTAEQAGNSKFPFSIKAYPFRGTYLDSGRHWDKFGGAYPAGVHLGFELPSQQQRPWQQYLGNATVGAGLSWIDLGHKMLGHAVTVYPYILFNAIDTDHFQMKFKVAGGLGAVTEHWYTQEDQDPENYYEPTVNTIFGCTVNVYLNAGIQLNVPITKSLAAGAEFGYIHMSNGRTNMPNIGLNALFGSVGLTATFNSDVKKKPIQFPDQPYGWAVNITGSAGAQQSAIEDTHKFLVSSFHAGTVYHVNNWYAVGLGLDVFYNGAVTKNTARSLYCDGDFSEDTDDDGEEDWFYDCLTCGDEKDIDYTTAQRFRAGISLNNEFKFGDVTAIVDWGLYFYNPSRHIYDTYHQEMTKQGKIAVKRPLLYASHGAGSEEVPHYIRFGLRYRLFDNVYLQASCKTHLHIAEFVEFGLGYQIPFYKNGSRPEGKGKIYHHRRNWWKD